MAKTIQPPLKSLKPNSDKDKKLYQLDVVYNAYFKMPLTMKQCDKVTGIMRESICRYNRVFRQNKQLYCIGKTICPITKHKANLYTTNPDLMPINPQLNLFANGN